MANGELKMEKSVGFSDGAYSREGCTLTPLKTAAFGKRCMVSGNPLEINARFL